jgi:hypothetical protein
MRRSLRPAAAILLIVALNAPAYGWGNVGHMAVAFVAYRKLTPRARGRVDRLVSLNPKFTEWQGEIPRGASAADRRMMLFMIAATWPDQIKDDNQFHSDGPDGGNRPPDDGTADRNVGYTDTARHKYWHFIDRPFSQDGARLENPPVPNAQTQIAAFRAVLASDGRDDLKSYDLVWLLHVVGDVHQPLHAAARFGRDNRDGDAGGNEVNVCDPACDVRLHAFWDGLLGGGRSLDPVPAVNVGRGLPEVGAALANDLNVRDWLNESFDLARSTVYHDPPIGLGAGPFRLTRAYRDTARQVANQRAALAGARLANILNNELR